VPIVVAAAEKLPVSAMPRSACRCFRPPKLGDSTGKECFLVLGAQPKVIEILPCRDEKSLNSLQLLQQKLYCGGCDYRIGGHMSTRLPPTTKPKSPASTGYPILRIGWVWSSDLTLCKMIKQCGGAGEDRSPRSGRGLRRQGEQRGR